MAFAGPRHFFLSGWVPSFVKKIIKKVYFTTVGK
jgi:hypothetical protein